MIYLIISLANISNSPVQHGGWAEEKDIDCFPYSPDSDLPQDSAIIAWYSKIVEAASTCGVNLRMPSARLKQKFEEAGFINVTVEEFVVTFGSRPRKKILKEIKR